MREVLPVEVMCPAVGQGALGIEARAEDATTLKELAFLDDRAARRATTAERALLRTLGGGCQVPIGAYAEDAGGVLTLTAIVAEPDGGHLLREQQTGSDPEELGARVGQTLLARGADSILRTVYGEAVAAPQQP